MEKLKNIKIVFTDIDGTLSNSNRKISNETINAIKNAVSKGIIVVLCSGRNNQYVCKLSKKANASNYVISCNGSEIYDYNSNIHIYENNIKKEDIIPIWKYCNDNNLGLLLNCENIRYCNNNHYIEEEDKKIINSINNIKENIFQLVTFGYDYEKMNNLEKIINSSNLKIINLSNSYINKNCSKHHFFFDIINKSSSKGNAIEKLLNHLNLKKENAIGFGDHINDYDLFDSVGFKIAMGNADNKLKDKADFITLSNDDNGVAHFLNNFIDYGDDNHKEK